MRKYLLILSLILISGISYAQFKVYHHFPDSNAWWSEETSSQMPCGGIGGKEVRIDIYFDYHLAGDTLINGIIYHKLNKSGGYEDVEGCTGITWYNYDYRVGFIREDTMKHIFICFLSNGCKDTLLYDFNLKLGDTLPNTYNHNSRRDTDIVYKVDSILIGKSYRRQFHLIHSRDTQEVFASIIEGIGCSYGLLETIIFPFEGYSNLDCFKQNDTVTYPYNGSSCQLYYLGLPDIKKSQITFTVYPNPANQEVTLQYKLPAGMDKARLNLYNPLGQMIKSEAVTTSSGTITEDVSALPGGIYYYTLKTEGEEAAVSKLVIIR